MKINLLLSLSVSFFLACSAGKSTNLTQKSSSDNTSIWGIEWKLVSVKSPNSTTFITPDKRIPTLTFSADGKSVSGNAGCNRYSGKVTWAGNQMTFGNLISTRMFCLEGMEMETAVFSVLQGTLQYELSNEKLILKKGNNAMATFERSR